MSTVPSDTLSPEEQIVRLKQQLLQLQKLTALGQLVSTTTHEFNNVLMTILNYAKMGLRSNDTPSRDKAFEKILAAAQRAARITNGILGFARNRGNQFEPTDMKRVVDDTLMLLEREFQKYRVQVETHIGQVPAAWANANQVQQVLMNLLVNARQAMPHGGRILVQLGFDPSAQMVELSVRDNGQGMTTEVMHQIFDGFFTTKDGPDDSGRGGNGIGLAACREIIEAHHGKIRVESTPGRGTQFTIRVPMHVPPLPRIVPTFETHTATLPSLPGQLQN